MLAWDLADFQSFDDGIMLKDKKGNKAKYIHIFKCWGLTIPINLVLIYENNLQNYFSVKFPFIHAFSV